MAAAKGDILNLTGNLDIRQAELLHESLKKLKAGKKNIILDFSEADDIDLAVLQLLFSFKKSIHDESRTVEFENVNEKIRERISLCDFAELLQGS